MGYNRGMVNIIGYEDVVVGTEVVQQPIYDEPVIVIGSGDKQIVQSISEYEAEMAAAELAAQEAALALDTTS